MCNARWARLRAPVLLLALVSLWPGSAQAQIFGRGSRTEFISGFGIRAFASFLQAEDLLSGSESIDDPAQRQFTARITPVAIVYGLRPRISLIGMFPLVDKELTRRGPTGIERLGAGTGLGDATFLVKWRAFKRDRGRGSLQVALQAGVKAPTGSSRLHESAGELLPPQLQRGTGSWDPVADLITSYVTPSGRWFFNASIGVVVTTAAHDIERGDRFGYDAMVKTRITPLNSRDLFLLLELNGLWQGRTRTDSRSINSSGGHLLYLSPGVQYLLRSNVVIEAGVQLPVARRVNGVQLAPSIRALFGLRYVIVP